MYRLFRLMIYPKIITVSAPKFSFFLFFMVAGMVVLVDQLTKYFISISIPLHEFINIIPNIINLTHIRNPGGAFGFMSQNGSEVKKLIFIGIACLTVIAIIFYCERIAYYRKSIPFGFSLILGGTIGNTIDRLRLGEVIDFIDILIYSHHWPAFNIADSAIVVGIVTYVLYVTLEK